MKKYWFTLIFFYSVAFALQTYSNPVMAQGTDISKLEHEMDKLEAQTSNNVSRLETRIDGMSNGVLYQIIFPLVIGVITYLLGLWSTKRQMRIISDEKIKEWIEKIAPSQCDTALKEYLKKRFPGNIEYLMAAAKKIAYDQELRQIKSVRILGMNPTLSSKILDHLRENDFPQVEFVTYVEGNPLPKADVILIDRYSCLKSEKPMTEDQVRKIITSAKSSAENPCVHYFGKFISGLPEIMTEKHALSSAEFSLIPNLMDHLRFVYPQK